MVYMKRNGEYWLVGDSPSSLRAAKDIQVLCNLSSQGDMLVNKDADFIIRNSVAVCGLPKYIASLKAKHYE